MGEETEPVNESLVCSRYRVNGMSPWSPRAPCIPMSRQEGRAWVFSLPACARSRHSNDTPDIERLEPSASSSCICSLFNFIEWTDLAILLRPRLFRPEESTVEQSRVEQQLPFRKPVTPGAYDLNALQIALCDFGTVNCSLRTRNARPCRRARGSRRRRKFSGGFETCIRRTLLPA